MYRYGGMGRSSRSGLGQVSTDVLANLPMQGPSLATTGAFTAPQYTVQPSQSDQFTTWINANAVTVLIGAAVFLVAWKVIQK